MRNWFRKSWFFLLVAIFLAGCPEQKSGNNVLATYDGGSLTVEDVQAHYRKLKKNSRYRDKPEMLTPEYAFDHAVNMEMIISNDRSTISPTILSGPTPLSRRVRARQLAFSLSCV